MDVLLSAHQALFGYEPERREDANLVRRVHLCADRHRQKGASSPCLALHFVTDFVGLNFRENAFNAGFSRPDSTSTEVVTFNQLNLFDS